MTLALDTNVAIELLRGRHAAVRERFSRALDEDQAVVASVIVLHELIYGAARSARPAKRRADVDMLMQDIAVEPLTAADVAASGEISARLSRAGTQIGAYDVLIAGQTLSRGWTLVTANVREFSRIEGLTVEDWTRD